MENLFICYAKCQTCQKAKKWLDSNSIAYTQRDIKAENPTFAELSEWIPKSGKPAGKFFNTSGLIYKQNGLKDKVKTMTETEQIKLLATDGMLVRRPILITEETVLVGFNADEWEKIKK